MGRKQKLRQARHSKNLAADNANENQDSDSDECDREFPKSEAFLKGKQLMNKRCLRNDKILRTFMRGANEYGCIHSMSQIGNIHIKRNPNGQFLHLTVPTLVEGSIRGGHRCAYALMYVLSKAKPLLPNALSKYWMNIVEHREKAGGFCADVSTATSKLMNDHTNRMCAVCSKKDTATVTLQQCIGCSTYCYCNEDCQTHHWEDQNHRSECKQVQILNKYHKPYAQEIRAATIRGETHPALQKLRSKLGLSRPVEDYQELRDSNTYEGKSINPFQFLVARNDGTVWIGSSPNALGPQSSSTNTTTTPITTTTTTTTTSARPAKGGNNKERS